MEIMKNNKQEAYNRWLTTKDPADMIKYKQELAKYKRCIIENKNDTWERRCNEVNTYIGGSRSRAAWNLIKSLRKNNANKAGINPIEMKKWIEHYSRELTENRQQYTNTQNPQIYITGPQIKIKKDMVRKAIKTLKSGRASGPEGIPAELFKHGTDKLITAITELLTRYANGERIPDKWKEAWITPIYKKGSRDQCSNYRCISVTDTLSRIYGKVLKQLVEKEYEPNEIEEQAGFRSGRSCIDHVFTLSQLHEKRTATNRESHLLFVDLTKAYDTIPLQKLWEVLNETQINTTIIRAIQQLYDGQTSRIKLGNRLSTHFQVSKGLRQGCCLSPTLFNIYINRALKNWRNQCHRMGVELSEDRNLYTVHFADDQVVLAQEKEDLEFMTRKLLKEYEKWGLTVNQTKTKYLCVGNQDETPLQLEDGNVIEICQEYTYLGTTITTSGRTEPEIKNRIQQGKKVIGCLNPILWAQNISKKNKKLLFNAVLKNITLYGCEAWQINKQTENDLRVLELDYWRRSARKSRLDKVPNDEIKRIMEVDDELINELQRKQLEWYGHVERMSEERLPKLIKNWIPWENRKRGRPKTTWIEGIHRYMSQRNLTEGDWNNRDEWRQRTRRRITL